MTPQEAIKILKFERGYFCDFKGCQEQQAYAMAIKALEQQPITWIVGKDNAQVAVKDMPIDKMQKICAIIGDEEQQSCNDCISREEALRHRYFINDDDGRVYSVVRVDDIIDLPSVTTQPKIGYWITADVEGNRVWHCNCSECGKDPQDYIGGSENWWLIKNKLPNYCPNCGEKMEVE